MGLAEQLEPMRDYPEFDLSKWTSPVAILPTRFSLRLRIAPEQLSDRLARLIAARPDRPWHHALPPWVLRYPRPGGFFGRVGDDGFRAARTGRSMHELIARIEPTDFGCRLQCRQRFGHKGIIVLLLVLFLAVGAINTAAFRWRDIHLFMYFMTGALVSGAILSSMLFGAQWRIKDLTDLLGPENIITSADQAGPGAEGP